MTDRERGEYRPIYSSIVKTDEFRALTVEAKLLFYTLKLLLKASGIAVLYDDEIRDASSLEDVEGPRRELVDGGWLAVEGRVHWLINGLRFEPGMKMANKLHRRHVERLLAELPRLQIVLDFAERYRVTPPFTREQILPKRSTPRVTPRVTPIDIESPSVSHSKNGVGTPEPEGVAGSYGDTLAESPPPPPPLSHTAREREGDEPDGLTAWLNGYSATLPDWPPLRDPLLRMALLHAFGPDEMHAGAWARPDGSRVPADQRPRIFASVIEGYASEGKRGVVTSEFAGMLRKRIADEHYATTRVSQSPDAAQESATERARREALVRRAARERDADREADAAAEARMAAIEDAAEWMAAQPDELTARANLLTRAKLKARGYGEGGAPLTIKNTVLLEVVEQLRAGRSESAAQR